MNDLLKVLEQMGIKPTDVDDQTKGLLLNSVGLPANVLDPKNVFLINADDLEERLGKRSAVSMPQEKEPNLTPEFVMKHLNFSQKEIKSLTYLKVTVEEAIFIGEAPKDINRIGLLLALRNVQYSRVPNSSQGVEIIVKYPDFVPQNAKEYLSSIIHKHEIGKTGKVTDVELLDEDEKFIMNGFVSGNVASACSNILADYPGKFVRVKGDLDLRKSISKKSEQDDTFINRIIVSGDFYASKYGKAFPRKVQGTAHFINLGKGDAEKGEPSYITKETVFPVTEKIDCSYSISGFDVFFKTDEKGNLVGTLPYELKTLVVEPGLIREDYIHRNLTNVLKFVELYQSVIVVDTKGNYLLNNLIEMSKDIDTKKTPVQEEKTVKPVSRKTTIINAEQKRLGTDLTVKDLMMYVRSIQDKYGADKFSDRELRNFVKEALKYTNLTKKKVKDKEGNLVDSINFSEFNIFIENLDKAIEARRPKEDDGNSDGDVIVLSLLYSSGSLVSQKMKDMSHPAH